MAKWLEKGKWTNKKDATEVLKTFKKDYKKAGLPTSDIKIKRTGGKYKLMQKWD